MAMPTREQIEFFQRWNEAAERADRAADRSLSMGSRLEDAVRLSALASALSVADDRPERPNRV
jgi:hypothetical protein